jgi:hypothetical protein
MAEVAIAMIFKTIYACLINSRGITAPADVAEINFTEMKYVS